MSATFIQAVAKETAGSSLSYIGFDMVVTAGHAIYLAVATPSTTDQITGVATTGGNASTGAWTKQKVRTGADATSGTVEIWSTTITSTAGGTSLVFTISSSGSGISAVCSEFSGANENIDSTGSAQGSALTTLPVTSASFTTTNANDVWIAATCTNDTPGAVSAASAGAPNNWTQAGTATGSTSGMLLTLDYQIVSSTVTAATMGGTHTTNNIDQHSGAIVAFKQSAPLATSSIWIGVL